MTVDLQAAIGLRGVALDPHLDGVFLTDHQIRTYCDTNVLIHIVPQKTNRSLIFLAFSYKLRKVKAVGIPGHIPLLRPVAAGGDYRVKQRPLPLHAVAVPHHAYKFRQIGVGADIGIIGNICTGCAGG